MLDIIGLEFNIEKLGIQKWGKQKVKHLAAQAATLLGLGVLLFLFIAGIKLNFTSILYTRVLWSVGHTKREEQEGGKEIKESKWDIGGRRMMNNREEEIQGENS